MCTDLLINPDHVPKLCQSDLLCGSKSPSEKALQPHGMLAVLYFLTSVVFDVCSYSVKRCIASFRACRGFGRGLLWEICIVSAATYILHDSPEQLFTC